MTHKQLDNLRELLKTANDKELAECCAELIAAGVKYKDIIRVVLCRSLRSNLHRRDERFGSKPKEAIAQANNFLVGGHKPERLFRDMILWVNQNCVGNGYYAGQRGMLDAWDLAKDHPDRNRILPATAGWMADYRNQHFNHKKRYGPIWGANLSDDGALLAIRTGGTRVYDTATGDELWTASTPKYCNYAGFTADGKNAISEHDGTLHYHNATTGEPITTIVAIEERENDHTIFGGANQSRDRSTIVTAGWHGQVRVWNATTREIVCSFDVKLG